MIEVSLSYLISGNFTKSRFVMYTLDLYPRFSIFTPNTLKIEITSIAGFGYVAEIARGIPIKCDFVGENTLINIVESNRAIDDLESWDFEAIESGNTLLLFKQKSHIQIGHKTYGLPTFVRPSIKDLDINFSRIGVFLSQPSRIRCSDINNIKIAVTIGVIYWLRSSESGGSDG